MNANLPFSSPRIAKLAPALHIRSGLRAGGYNSCMAYCNQERVGCVADPATPNDICDDRYPVCQNACTVCGATYY